MSYREATALQLEQQARFEVEGFEEGVKRYQEAVAARDLTELTAGQRLLREIVPGLAERIVKARAEGLEAIGGNGSASHPPLWAWPIQLLADDESGEKMAVLTLGCALAAHRLDPDDAGYGIATVSSPMTPLARRIASAVRMQIEFDRWAGQNPDLERRLRARHPTVHRNVWRRWRVKVEALRAEPWEPGAEVALGAHLIHALVEAAPDRFKIENLPIRGKPTAHLTIADETIELIDDVSTRAEIARPLLMPMLCPPIPWSYQ